MQAALRRWLSRPGSRLVDFPGVDEGSRLADLLGPRVTSVEIEQARLTAVLRVYDKLGRFGGEEFAVVLPNADQDEARRVGERLRRAVAELPIPGVDPDARLTVSIGAAIAGTHGAGLLDLLTAADLALYRAKAAGRDQVAFAPGLPSPAAGAVPQPRRPEGAR